ncbi:MAG: hypothetical protein KatS3mg087_0631 [Patescibacteria group bacterium]|nr:MAG: hypothetical protein KatS3mg087_0631 [Patescibacteria group bacterium]
MPIRQIPNRVQITFIGTQKVSTIKIRNGCFETAIFDGDMDSCCWTTHTSEDAIAKHQEVVSMLVDRYILKFYYLAIATFALCLLCSLI